MPYVNKSHGVRHWGGGGGNIEFEWNEWAEGRANSMSGCPSGATRGNSSDCMLLLETL